MGNLKSRNPKLSVTAGAGATLVGLWSIARGTIDAATLPSDADNLARAMLEVPALVPYVALAVLVLLLAWSFWPRADDDGSDDGSDDSGGTYTQNSSGSGNNTMNF